MDTQLGSESAADVGTENLNPVRIDFQCVGHATAHRVDNLSADVELEIFTARHGHTGIRLHRLRKAIRRIVLAVDLNRSTIVSGIEISHRAVGWQPKEQLLWRVCAFGISHEVEIALLGCVRNAHKVSCGLSLH